MSEKTFKSVRRKATLRNEVTATIRRAIIKGELESGQQVNQAQIAAQLEVSRAVVREALAHLEEEGLIDNIPYKGTFVRQIAPEFVEELFSVRRVLETFAIKRFIERAEPHDIEALRANIAEMRKLGLSTDREQSVNLDLNFHYLIFERARNSVLMAMWRSIESGLRLCLAQGHRLHKDKLERIGKHPEILAAIEKKDVEYACELMDAHIRQAEEHIANSLCWGDCEE